MSTTLQSSPALSRSNCVTFRDALNGESSFFNHPDYIKSTTQDLLKITPLPVTYTYIAENKFLRIVKLILSLIIFPVLIYNFLHSYVAKIAILPASNLTLLRYPANFPELMRSAISLESEWKYKRFTVDVDGYKIDAMLIGKESTLGNGRWILSSNANMEFYERKMANPNSEIKSILSSVNGNGIVFNYPGVGASTGMPNRNAMAKAYRAMLTFLEDKNSGVGASEIIGYGHSIGCGAQSDALKVHQLKKDIKYVFVKSRTFSDLSTTASLLTTRLFGFLVKLLGWNMDPARSSMMLKAPEIIMQTARVETDEVIKDSSKVIDDGIIPAGASLAKALLDDNKCPKKNKVFIGVKALHNEEFDLALLAENIEMLLKK